MKNTYQPELKTKAIDGELRSMRGLKDRSELYRAKKSLMFTSYILALLCLGLEVVISISDIRTRPELNNFNWVFRWIIFSNLLNAVILLAQKILIWVYRDSMIKQMYIIGGTLVAICGVVSCQHYYYNLTHLIFFIPILLSVPAMSRKFCLTILSLSSIGFLLSFFIRSFDNTCQDSFWPDFMIALAFYFVFGGLSYQLVLYLVRQNKKLVASKIEAELANNAKSDFLSNMSHEIRTPINSILGMNEMILRETNENNIAGYAENISRSGGALLSLINDILDLSKIESGKIEIVCREYELKTLILDTVTMVRERIEKKNLKFIVDVDESVPSVLYGDDSRIKEILLNFLTNAAKYTKEGSITYTVTCVDNGGYADMSFSVKDTGNGIREEDLRKMYGRFERFDLEQNRNIEGTGLGLRISKQLANLMGGEISVSSEYGVGSDFVLGLRQKIASEDPIGKVDFLKNEIAGRKKYSVLFKAPEAKILVVDDIDMNLFVIENLLKQTEMKVDLAESGDECIRKSCNEKYDLILIDHMMPGMNGMDTFSCIRDREDSRNRETPCVMLTANAFNGAREMYEKAGFADYVTKPIECDKLERTVSRLLPKEKVTFI